MIDLPRTDPDDLRLRAAKLATELKPLTFKQLRRRYATALQDAKTAPPWWRQAANTELAAVTIALELLAQDESTSDPRHPSQYLQVARAAIKAAR